MEQKKKIPQKVEANSQTNSKILCHFRLDLLENLKIIPTVWALHLSYNTENESIKGRTDREECTNFLLFLHI